MTDHVSANARSAMMAKVKGRDTSPELAVRRALFGAGFRFRLHRADLPGRPDIVLPRHRLVAFVHGCFWHGHDCPKGRRRPASNMDFWNRKLDGNAVRDERNQAALEAAGWTVAVIWECAIEAGTRRLLEMLEGSRQTDRRAAPSDPTR